VRLRRGAPSLVAWDIFHCLSRSLELHGSGGSGLGLEEATKGVAVEWLMRVVEMVETAEQVALTKSIDHACVRK